MLTTIEGHYADGKVELQETPRGIERARVIVTFLPEATENATIVPGVELYGVWKAMMPANVDIDELLRDIRSEWTNDLETAHG
jgi:hypothetical protein